MKTYSEAAVPENTCADVDSGNERAILVSDSPSFGVLKCEKNLKSHLLSVKS